MGPLAESSTVGKRTELSRVGGERALRRPLRVLASGRWKYFNNATIYLKNCYFFQQDKGSGDENGNSKEMLYDGLSIQQPVTIGNSDFLFALSASD